MAGEAVDLKIEQYMAEHNCGYIEGYRAVVFAEDADDDVRAYQAGATSVGDLLARLRGGLPRLEGLARAGTSATIERLTSEMQRLIRSLEALEARDADLLTKTEPAIDQVLSGIAAEERRRSEQQRTRTVGQSELGGLQYRDPAADRGDAGRRLDELARSHQARHGGSYGEAFDAVRQDPDNADLTRMYGSVEGAA